MNYDRILVWVPDLRVPLDVLNRHGTDQPIRFFLRRSSYVFWSRERDSNPRTAVCSRLPNRSAIPTSIAEHLACARKFLFGQNVEGIVFLGVCIVKLEKLARGYSDGWAKAIPHLCHRNALQYLGL